MKVAILGFGTVGSYVARILADISEPDVIVAILGHLGLPTEPPPIARARGPTWVEPA